MIKISKATKQPIENEDVWSYPISELEYLMETGGGEFLLWDGRLYESEDR